MRWPPRSTPSVSGLPTEWPMTFCMEFGSEKVLPLTETMVSPALRPASWAGV